MLRNCGVPRTHHLDHVMLLPRASDDSHTERPATAWDIQVMIHEGSPKARYRKDIRHFLY